MGSLWERLTVDGAEARLRGGSELPVAEIVERLEAAGSAGISDLAAADLLASLAFAVLGGHDALGPPLNQQAPPASPAQDRARRAGAGGALGGLQPTGPAGPGGGLAPDPRLLGFEPRGRPGRR